jgi:hypothetical protein
MEQPSSNSAQNLRAKKVTAPYIAKVQIVRQSSEVHEPKTNEYEKVKRIYAQPQSGQTIMSMIKKNSHDFRVVDAP